MHLSFRRPPNATYLVRRSVWLQNTSDQHILLHLGTGEVRLDKDHRLRFHPDILHNAQVKALVEAGKMTVQDA
ncbi:MAG: hypothetical protein GXP37_12990 [Chloroflexi bacterium]|nr:hypothetical protein [Chloroflexota bacterium]